LTNASDVIFVHFSETLPWGFLVKKTIQHKTYMNGWIG